MIISTIIATILCAFLYRLGGLSKEEGKKYLPFIPAWMFNTKARDMGVPAACFAWMLKFYPAVPWYVHLLSFGMMFGAMTTYWQFVAGEDNFWLHGFMIGLAYLPYAFFGHMWLALFARAIALAVSMGLWCEWFSNDWVEELGRGAFIGLTLPLMLIGG